MIEKPKAISLIEEISDEDWANTPESIKRVIKVLLDREKLLQEKVNVNPQNSSQPPSSQEHKDPKAHREPSKRSRGGQPGHSKHERKLYDEAECTEIIHHYPEACQKCGSTLLPEQNSEAYRHQIVDIPEIKPEVVEHRFHQCTCQNCGHQTRAWDKNVIDNGYGNRLRGLVGLLSGMYRQSERMIQQMLQEVFQIGISLGSIEKLRQEVSAAISEAVAESQRYVQEQGQIHMDETGFKQGNSDGKNPEKRKAWLWVMKSGEVSYFGVSLSRGQKEAQNLLGEFDGILITDRYSGYSWYDLEKRQVCWAHLKRDFQKIAERGGESEKIGVKLLAEEKKLFNLWHKFRQGEISREELGRDVAPIRAETEKLLREGAGLGTEEKTVDSKTGRTCQELLKVERALWTFVLQEGVEPTNNAAERALRPAVLWKKNSFGAQSEAGSIFFARIMTVVVTLREQKKNVMEFLVNACDSFFSGSLVHSIIPLSP